MAADLDPARFPAETRARLVLALAAMACIGVLFAVFNNLSQLENAAEACSTRACYVAHTRSYLPKTLILYGGGLDALAIGCGIYAAQVGWRSRRKSLKPLPAASNQDLLAAIESYSRQAGLPGAPEVRVSAGRGHTAVFGRASAPILAVDLDLINDFTRDRTRFDAILHHELFHVRSDDVRTYYRSLAVYRGILVQALAFGALLAGAVVLYLHQPLTALLIVLQVLCLVGLGLAALRDYLRRREFLADRWAADHVGVTAVAAALSRDPSRSRRNALFPTHPTVAARIAALHRRRLPLTLTPVVAFLSATAAGMLITVLAFLLRLAGSSWLYLHDYGVAGAVGGLVLGRILAGGIGAKVGTHLLAGAAAAAGLYLGGLLSPMSLLDGEGPSLPFTWLQAAVTVLALVAFVLWARLGAGGGESRWRDAIASLVLAGLLAPIYYLAGLAHDYRAVTTSPDRDAGVALRPFAQVTDAFLTGLWHQWLTWGVVLVALAGPVVAARTRSGNVEPAVAAPATHIAPPVEKPPVEKPVEKPPVEKPAEKPPVEKPAKKTAETTTEAPRPTWVVPALSGAALACLALVVGWSPDLLFLLPTSAAAMVVAWRAQLNRPLGTAALSAVYVIVAVTAVAGTVPGHHYRTLGVVAFGLIGTAAYGAFGLPVPGDNRHIFILIVPAVLFHSQTWLLVVWAVAAFVLGLLLNRRSPEPMIAVAFAVTAALCSAAEVWLAR